MAGRRHRTAPGTLPGPARASRSRWASPPSTRTGRRTPSWSRDCVHCGFCLPTCPTYALWGEEMDSPRGRIHLMSQGLRAASRCRDSMVGHFDACLGLHGLRDRLPVGVQYDRLIEATRAQVERAPTRPRRERALREAIFALFPYPRRLRLMRGPLRAYQRTGLQRLRPPQRLLQRLSPTLRDDGGRRAADRQVARRCPRGSRPAGRAARGRRHADRLRAARVLPRRQRGHRPGARRRGLRRRRPARAGLLRRAVASTTAARPRRRRFARRLHRQLRRRRRRARRGQRGRLRLVDEGVRRAAGRRPGVRRAGGRRSRPRSAT